MGKPWDNQPGGKNGGREWQGQGQRPPQNQPRDFSNGNGNGDDETSMDDAVVEAYATRDRQNRLRERIEAQDLPVHRRLPELAEALDAAWTQRNGIVLLQGETGSGKSVYAPMAVRRVLTKYGLRDRIVDMQPRKDAASGIARAAAAVMGEELGRGVGFSTSEAKAVSPRSALAVITPGIFLRHLMNGELTRRTTGAVIVDELHEGSIDYHLALGLLKMMHERGEAPLMLLTSATINKERIQEFFGIAEEDYIKIEGRAHPVEKHYYTPGAEQGSYGEDKHYVQIVAEKVEAICKSIKPSDQGDVLVFLPGAREIKSCIAQIGKIPGVEVLPLHGSLAPEDRDAALWGEKPQGVKRRVIVSTNVAETSVTVPGIKIVVDSCRQRSVKYNPATGIIETGTEFISKDQAEQRAGRAGRVSAGTCYRMITEQTFTSMNQHPESEISRTNLSHLVLRLKAAGIDPQHFPYIEPPDPSKIAHGIKELQTLGAIGADGELTGIGREMGDLPFEPRIARMLIEARHRNCLAPALVLAAFARESNVLMGPTRKDEEEAVGWDEKNKKINARKKVQGIQNVFDRGNSDWLKALNIFAEALGHGVLEAMRRDRTPEGRHAQDEFYRWCKQHYLKAEALSHIAYRLQDYARYSKTRLDFSALQKQLRTANDSDLGAVILAGHPDTLLYKNDSYRMASYARLNATSGGGEINMSPGSEAFETAPALCIAAEITQGRGTGRRGAEVIRNYAQSVHPIRMEELRAVLPHLVVEQYVDTQYNPEADRIETTVLYHPKGASHVNIGMETRALSGAEAALAFAKEFTNGRVDVACFHRNKETLALLDALYHRSGGRVSKPDMIAWYVERLGGAASKAEVLGILDRLTLSIDDYCSPETGAEIDRDYPSYVTIRDKTYPVKYSFAPTSYWNSESKHSAVVTVAPEDLMTIEQADIPTLGSVGHPLTIIIQTTISYRTEQNADIEALKNTLEEERIRKMWSAWKQLPVPDIVVDDLQPLPSVETTGVAPIEYARRRSGEVVYAYPAITTQQTLDHAANKWVHSYAIRYYKNKEEAEAEQKQSERTREADNAVLQRARDRETLLEPAREMLRRVRAMLPASADDAIGISYSEFGTLKGNVEKAESLLQEKDYWGSSKETDPRQAMTLLQEAEDTLTSRRAEYERRVALLPRVRAERDALRPQVEQLTGYYTYMLYGVSADERERLSTIWQEVDLKLFDKRTDGYRYNAPELPDPDGARDLLTELKTAAEGKKLVGSVEMLERMRGIMEGRDRSYAHVIHVEGGRVVSSKNVASEAMDTHPKTIPIGSSGRQLFVQENKVIFVYASGRAEKYWQLPDGDYLVSRDAGDVIRLEPAEDSAEEGAMIPVESVQSNGDYEYNFGPLVQVSTARDRDSGWGYGGQSRRDVDVREPASGFNVFAEAFGKKKADVRTPDSTAPAAPQTAKQPGLQPAQPAPRPVEQPKEDEAMTETIRTELMRELELAELFLRDVLQNPEPRRLDTQTDKFISKQRKAAQDRLAELRTVRGEVRVADSATRARGRVQDSVRRSEKVSTTLEEQLRVHSSEWTTRLRTLLDTHIPAIQAEWGGTLTEQTRTALLPELVRFAKDINISNTDLRAAVENIVAERLEN